MKKVFYKPVLSGAGIFIILPYLQLFVLHSVLFCADIHLLGEAYFLMGFDGIGIL